MDPSRARCSMPCFRCPLSPMSPPPPPHHRHAPGGLLAFPQSRYYAPPLLSPSLSLWSPIPKPLSPSLPACLQRKTPECFSPTHTHYTTLFWSVQSSGNMLYCFCGCCHGVQHASLVASCDWFLGWPSLPSCSVSFFFYCFSLCAVQGLQTWRNMQE